MNPTSDNESPSRDLEDYQRATISRILLLVQFHMEEITKHKRWSRKGVNSPGKKFKHIRRSPSNRLQKILEEKVETDFVLIASDGQEIKCHKAVLTEKIPRFGILFSHKNMESISGRVQMEPRMNAEVTMAFLRYLYLHEMDAVLKSFDVAAALIYAGHYYDVPDLIKDVSLVFQYYEEKLGQVMDLEWGSIDKYWDLYDIVRLWEDEHESKRTAVNAIFGMIKKVWMKNCVTGSNTLATMMQNGTNALTEFAAYLTKNWEVNEPNLIEADDAPEYGSRGNRSAIRGRASEPRRFTFNELW